MNSSGRTTFILAVCLTVSCASAQVPGLVNYQGRFVVSGTNFSGNAQFKFALVSADGSQVFWGNAPLQSGQPNTNVTLAVSGGLFSVFLGDTNLAGMAALPSWVFTNPAVNLRVWANDGTHGMQQLTPDQRMGSAAYAQMAGNVPDGAVTPAKLATNTVSSVTAALAAQFSTLAAQVGALSNQVSALSNLYGSSLGSGLTMASADPQDASLGAQGFVAFASFAAPAWVTSQAAGAPSPRSGQAGVWTGQELMVWGGNPGAGSDFGSGGRYRPDLDAWQPVSTVSAPAARSQHAAVWSGQEMIIWGGLGGGSNLNTGARFNPTNQLWTAMNTTNAPAGRVGFVAVWTGSRFTVWGGRNNSGLLGDGAAYDPVADQWSALSLANAPAARCNSTLAWTGNRAIIWGGQNELGGLNTGAQLLCDINGLPTGWVALNTTNAPAGRSGHAAIWTGQKMVVWGGGNAGAFLGDGAAYDPVADAWAPITSAYAPTARNSVAAVWSGQEMLVFGGETATGTAADGAAYNPLSDTWRALSGAGSPLARSGATAAWSGSELLLFGGLSNGAAVGSLQRLNPQPAWYLYRKP